MDFNLFTMENHNIIKKQKKFLRRLFAAIPFFVFLTDWLLKGRFRPVFAEVVCFIAIAIFSILIWFYFPKRYNKIIQKNAEKILFKEGRINIVSPDLLGISSGACVGAAFAILLELPAPLVQLSALGTGLLTVILTTLIPGLFRNRSSLMLVLSGVIMSGFMSALLGIAKYVADPENHLATIVYWTMGSFSNVRMKDVLLISPPILAAMAALLLLRWRVNLLSLGDAEAGSLGVNVRRARGVTILFSTVLTACAVCLCGTIGWAGLIVPHLGRLIVGQDNRYLLPMSAVLGALFLVVVDTLARNLTGSEIPLSIITGVLGAPLFVWLLARQRARIGDGQ